MRLVGMVVFLLVLVAAIGPPSAKADLTVYDPPAQARLERVTARIAKTAGVSLHPKIVRMCDQDGRPVLNAYVDPQGNVGVSEEWFRRPDVKDKHLAAIVAHEAGHRHGQDYIKSAAGVLGGAGVGRLIGKGVAGKKGEAIGTLFGVLAGKSWVGHKIETHSDEWSVNILAKAGYDPHAMAEVFHMLKAEEARDGGGGRQWLTDHPDIDKRIVRAENAAAKYDQPVGIVGEVKGPARNPRGNPLLQRRIEIDADKMEISGNWAWWLRENLAAMLRNRARASGLVEVAVTGRQFNNIAETQDRIHDSGRYSQDSRRQVPRGQMIAPTDQYQVTAFANLEWRNRGGTVWLDRGSLSAQKTEARAVVRLTVEPIGIASGLSDQGYEATGEVRRTINFNASGGSWGSFGSTNSSNSNVESELMEEAASRAVDKIIVQLAPEPLEVVPDEPGATGQLRLVPEDGRPIPIEITSGKAVYPGDKITFYRQDKAIAQYEVLVIRGQDIEVRTIFERTRPRKGDPFKTN